MRFWQVLAFTEPEELVELAVGAEEAGFHGVLLSDHLFFPAPLASRYPYAADGRPGFDASTPFPEPFAAISAMAAVTSRLRFATMVYVLPLRHPVEVAKLVSTASRLSGGRVALGCGAGWIREEFDALDVDFASRGRRMDEAIAVLRQVFANGRVAHRGACFDLGPLTVNPAPRAPVPIWVGGRSAPALHRAARLGDGWIGTGHEPEDAAHLLDRLHALRHEAGRGEATFETIVPLTVPPEPGLLRRLETEHGLTSTTAWPFLYTLGPDATLAAKRDAMRRFGGEVIAKTG